MKKSEQYYTL